MRIHFIASQANYEDHLTTIMHACDRINDPHLHTDNLVLDHVADGDVTVTASQRDFMATKDLPGRHVYMEHGVGLQVHKRSTIVALNKYRPTILVPNWYTIDELRSVYCEPDLYVVGTPKMDELKELPHPDDRVLAVSFHWTGRGKNWNRYKHALQHLTSEFKVLGHGHPKDWPRLKQFWEDIGVEPVQDFREVLERAQVLACDHSSIIYEWAALDRSVVLLDRPHDVERSRFTPLRYADYANVGAEATPNTLHEEVRFAMDEPFVYGYERHLATENLFPHLGDATSIAAELIQTGETTQADVHRRKDARL